jgi:large conductance mechanosensitive channel
VTISDGVFINTVIAFLITAGAIFMVIKAVNTLKRKQEAAPAKPAVPPPTEVLLAEIRDLLKKK